MNVSCSTSSTSSGDSALRSRVASHGACRENSSRSAVSSPSPPATRAISSSSSITPSIAPGPALVHDGSVLVPDDLDTPAVVVSAELLERNLARMAALASAAGVALRPHAKTHKCLQIARRQLSHGAVGLTVATLPEAELFALDGCPSVFIAYPLWAGSGDRGARLAALGERTLLRVGVDSEAAAARLASAAPGLEVLIEVDSGQHRSGVAVGQVAPLAASCAKLGLAVAGAFTHPGHAYGSPSAVDDAAEDERAALAAAGEALAGLVDGQPVLSGRSSPT